MARPWARIAERAAWSRGREGDVVDHRRERSEKTMPERFRLLRRRFPEVPERGYGDAFADASFVVLGSSRVQIQSPQGIHREDGEARLVREADVERHADLSF